MPPLCSRKGIFLGRIPVCARFGGCGGCPVLWKGRWQALLSPLLRGSVVPDCRHPGLGLV